METLIIDSDVFKRMHKALGPGWTNRMTDRFGAEAVNFSKERFRRKDWHDRVHQSWKPRKRTDRGSLMTRTGRLKRSIRKMGKGTGYVIIGTDVPYAAAHNEGGKTKKKVYVRAHTRNRKARGGQAASVSQVKAHSRQMNLTLPKRQFLGPSRALELRLQLRLKKDVEKAFKKL